MPSLLAPSKLAAAAIALAALVLALVRPESLGDAAPAAALVLFAIGLWATGALPEYLTALLFFTLAMLFSVAPADVIFSGFRSTAFWLVFAGLVIGIAIRSTGLGARIADRLAGVFGTRYGAVILGTVSVGVALGFLMPSSMGRTVLLIPILIALADRLGFAPGSRGRIGIVLAGGFGAFNPPFGILPAVVPNMVMIGAAEQAHGWVPLYGSWLLTHFPVLGLAKAAAIAAMATLLFHDRAEPAAAEPSAPGPMSAAEKRLALVLGVALLGWVTDFLHGLSPAWIGMAAACLLLLPRIGVIAGEDFKTLNFASALYVAGILALGALVASSGLGDMLGRAMSDLAPLAPGAAFGNFLTVSVTSSLVGLVTTIPGVPAVMTPLAGQLAEAAGLPLATVLHMIAVGYSTVLLPYQAPPLVVAMQMGGIRVADGIKLVLAVATISLVVLLPLDYLWWRAIGLL